MSRDIAELRQALDEIDGKFVELFEHRMEVSREVAAYKKERGLPVLDQSREEQVLSSRVAMLSDQSLTKSCKAFFRELMRLSREEQEIEFHRGNGR